MDNEPEIIDHERVLPELVSLHDELVSLGAGLSAVERYQNLGQRLRELDLPTFREFRRVTQINATRLSRVLGYADYCAELRDAKVVTLREADALVRELRKTEALSGKPIDTEAPTTPTRKAQKGRPKKPNDVSVETLTLLTAALRSAQNSGLAKSAFVEQARSMWDIIAMEHAAACAA